MIHWQIRVKGLVQGVGFRPHVWHVAQQYQIRGTVCNDGTGVLIQAWGKASQLQDFLQTLTQHLPPLARIDQCEHQVLATTVDDTPPDFQIIASQNSVIHTGIVADAGMCAACRAELFDPNNRRYRYPFINCTHCGPRLSIVQGIPYDRANTSMRHFTLCPLCQREYDDPQDRRFHAQPNACPKCGPQIWLEDNQATRLFPLVGERDVVDSATRLLRSGAILAVMGMGGVHLVCDASNPTTVTELRTRKRRYQKPLALMARDTAIISRYCHLNPTETALLHDHAAPIVLLNRRKAPLTTPDLAPNIAEHSQVLGFMLPYTPLHALLLENWDTPLVMTSANISDEPQCISLDESRSRLSSLADYLLLHDRPIVNRVDDSVTRVLNQQPSVLRRARGYAPAPLLLPSSLHAAPPSLAMGSELKNTFALLRDGQVTLSQHLGDLEEHRTWQAYTHTLQLYRQLLQHQTAAIVVDLHPGYRSTQLGENLAREQQLPLLTVQHHHAHVAACLAENDWQLHDGKVLGVVLDGLGFGDDQTLWGGEWLLADYCHYQRLAHFKPVAMPGGIQAIRQPWRNLYAQLQAIGFTKIVEHFAELPCIQMLQQQPLATLDSMIAKQLNTPLSSSGGRLFDAAAAALGCCAEQISYEGQAAIELEAITPPVLIPWVAPYPFYYQQTATGCWEIDPAPLWCHLLQDLKQGYTREVVAAHFQRSIIDVVVNMTVRLVKTHPEITAVALSGGVFQNALLFEHVQRGLAAAGLRVLTHRQVPTNDGGLSLGQAAIGAARLLAN